MPKNNANTSGDYQVVCDRCDKWILHSKAKREWTGFLVCDGCLDHRAPQDFLKLPVEKLAPANARPVHGLPTQLGPDAVSGITITGSGNTFYVP